MKRKKGFFLFFTPFLILTALACASKPQTSILLNDLPNPSYTVQEVLAKEGKSDYFLLRDEGYSIRLIYLCANRIYNFVDDPDKNPILVSLQPLLDSQVEKRLLPDDRRRIWACMEKKVREEQSRVEEQKRSVIEERNQLAKAVIAALNEQNRIVAEIEFKKKLAEQRQRQIEEEMRRAEEERLRQVGRWKRSNARKLRKSVKSKLIKRGKRRRKRKYPYRYPHL